MNALLGHNAFEGWCASRTRELREDELHLWRVSLDEVQGIDALEAMLSADELFRMQRYHHVRDRRRFAACRGRLRQLLGGYAGMTGQGICLDYGARGKPRLCHAGDDLQFNVSHAGGMALMAFSRGREVGVDIEEMRPGVDVDALARAVLSQEEMSVFQQQSATDRFEMFYRYWVCKEAWLKARGVGMSIDPRSFSMSLDAAEPALQEDLSSTTAAPWSFAWVNVAHGFKAVVVCAGDLPRACAYLDFREA